MGYRTWVTMEVKDHGTMTKEETKKAFEELCEKADLMCEERNLEDLQTSGEDNNLCSLSTFVEESKRYPQLLLEGSIDGAIEDSSDQRMVRIRDGQAETVMAEITYAPFETLLTDREKQLRVKQPLQQLNRVELIGTVGRVNNQDVADKTIVRLSVATNYAYRDRDGGAVIETTWHQVTAFDEKGCAGARALARGDKVRVLGRITANKYTDASGEQKTIFEVIASSIEKIDTTSTRFEMPVEDDNARSHEQ